MRRNLIGFFLLTFCVTLLASCLKKSLYVGKDETEVTGEELYVYPFGRENDNVVAEFTIETNGEVDPGRVSVEIPALKYNKSWLFLLSLDDCKHSAFSCCWAAINGKPLTDGYYYDFDQLRAGDLPPDAYYLGKTLGSTDGAGNEVRFSFAITLAPEWDWMNAKSSIQKGYTNDYYRFFMKSGLTWRNVMEMMNYGTGIAFHNVRTGDETNVDSIRAHYVISQGIIQDKLSGRGCKFLAEPDGNKAYVTAAMAYEPIQVMTAQSAAVPIFPFKVKSDLHGELIARSFKNEEEIKEVVLEQLRLKKEDRRAVQIGMHQVGVEWGPFLKWMNDSYGKDGDDSVWFTSLEEYYEYNYYRMHGTVEKRMEGNKLKVTVRLPSGQYFYYPSVTVNLKGLDKKKVVSVTAGSTVTGLSCGAYSEGTMVNIDCRMFLMEHATRFVERYEADRTESSRADALYFVNMLKESDKKRALLGRIK